MTIWRLSPVCVAISHLSQIRRLNARDSFPMPARARIVRLARVCWERKILSIIVIVASVSTILLAALTPLITRQAVNDAIAGDTTRLPLLACGLLLIALLISSGITCAAAMPGNSLWVQHTLRSRAFDSIQKLDGAGGTPCVPDKSFRVPTAIFNRYMPCYRCVRCRWQCSLIMLPVSQ